MKALLTSKLFWLYIVVNIAVAITSWPLFVATFQTTLKALGE
jgi:hypothetical protein